MLPNGFSALYKKVNTLVFEGRGKLMDITPGKTYGSFTPMETINQGAHVSFAKACSQRSESIHFHLRRRISDTYRKHLDAYLDKT